MNPTDGVIAKKLNVARETINRRRRRNPALRTWMAEQLGVTAAALRPLVDRRIAHLAITGSVDHAKLFYQFVAKVGAPLEAGEANVPTASVHNYTLNLLVPRPEVPQIEQVGERRLPLIPRPPLEIEDPRARPPVTAQARSTPAAAIPPAAIPVLEVRR